MKRTIRTAAAVFLCLILTTCQLFAQSPGGKNISSSGAFVLDFESGEEIYSYQGDTARVPASMTKMMALYIVFEAIEEGQISFETTVPISGNVYNLSRNKSFTNTVPLHYSQTYTVKELIDLISVYSASASVVALAELVSGSEAEFVAEMNAKAQEMGLDAYYYDCAGHANNSITPRSMAVLIRNFISDYPAILDSTALSSVYFHGSTYQSTNFLLGSHYYDGADGFKTGTTAAAGYCFAGTAQRDGIRIITVTMASSSGTQRFVDTKNLLDYGFFRAGLKAAPNLNDSVWELGYRGIILDTYGMMQEAGADPEETLSSLCSAVTHYIHTYSYPSAARRSVTPYTDINAIAWELGYRGIIDDTAALIAEMEANPGGRLYWLSKATVTYLRERD